jgi:GntR family transcriptional regulator
MASLTAIPLHLDPASPTPLYHQIVQAIRWRIGTGVLVVGESLPSARRAAEEWGVNFHTVRQAYGELARQGLVESQVGSGTRVVSAGTASGELRGFLEQFSAEAERRFGLSRAELAAYLGRPPRPGEPASRVLLVECNTHQCTDLAQQLAGRWRVTATPWELGRTDHPPDFPIVSSYFHLNEVRDRWPDRIARMHFAALQVDPGVIGDLAGLLSAGKVRHLILCEQDATTGRQMAADVSAQLPGNPEIAVTTRSPVSVLRSRRRNELVLVAPRVWDRQGPEVRTSSSVLEVRYVFRSDHLEALGAALGVSSA